MWCTCVDVYYHAFNLMKANVKTVVSLEKLSSKVLVVYPLALRRWALCSLQVARHDNLDRIGEKKIGEGR